MTTSMHAAEHDPAPQGEVASVTCSNGAARTVDLDKLRSLGLAADSPLLLCLGGGHGFAAVSSSRLDFEPFVLEYLEHTLQRGALPTSWQTYSRPKLKQLIAFADYFMLDRLQDLAWNALADLDGVAPLSLEAREAAKRMEHCDEAEATEALHGALDGLTWTIVVTSQLIRGLQETRTVIRMSCLQSLMELASGVQDSSLLQKHKLVDADHGLKSLECGAGWRLLWRTDFGYDSACRGYVEVIEAYALVQQDEVARTVAWLRRGWLQLHRGQSTAREAAQKLAPSYSIVGKRRVRLPRVVSEVGLGDFDMATVQPLYVLTPEVLMYLHESHVAGHNDSVSRQLPIRMSEAEADLVTREGPVVVVGRSGTGKTLSAVYRLWAHHRSYTASQLFLTLSPALCKRVDVYFQGLERHAGRAVNGPRRDIGGGITQGLQQLAEPGVPTFLTVKEFLRTLDRELVTPFFPRRLGTRTMDTSRVVFADEIQLGLANSNVMTELDFNRFLAEVWPKLAGSSPVPAALLWREIQTVIKGSNAAGCTTEGFLSEEQYLKIGHKLSPGVCKDRWQVYKSFRHFRRHCLEGRFFDRNDLAFHILRCLNTNVGMQLPKIDCIYIDEVQDLSQLELSVVMHMCRHPRSLFMTGDTSQTISSGVDFRFCDLVSTFTELYPSMPPVELLSLTTNWRSRSPIVRLANTVVQSIEVLFPSSIDVMPMSQGVMAGPTPVFIRDSFEELCAALLHVVQSREAAFGADFAVLVRTEAAKALVSRGLAGSALVLTIEEAKGLEFNACIVLNFFKDSPYSDWGVMRRLMCHGGDLKFKAGKRPNFDSKANRVLCSELKKLYVALTRSKHCLWLIDSSERAVPVLELWRDAGLARESGMVQEGDLGEVMEMEQLLFEAMGSQSSWRQMGRQLLEAGQYQTARQCFLRAGDEAREELCRAHLLAQKAEAEARAARSQEAKRRAQQSWRAAAALFERHNRVHQAACLANGGPQGVLEAARLYLQIHDKPRASQLWEAVLEATSEIGMVEVGHVEWACVAELHVSMGERARAAAAYERAKDPRKAAVLYNTLVRELEASNANYRRSKRWGELKQEAARCFRQAKMPAEAAECLAELRGDREVPEAFPEQPRMVILRHQGTAGVSGETLAGLEDADPQQSRGKENTASAEEPQVPSARESNRTVVLQHRGGPVHDAHPGLGFGRVARPVRARPPADAAADAKAAGKDSEVDTLGECSTQFSDGDSAVLAEEEEWHSPGTTEHAWPVLRHGRPPGSPPMGPALRGQQLRRSRSAHVLDLAGENPSGTMASSRSTRARGAAVVWWARTGMPPRQHTQGIRDAEGLVVPPARACELRKGTRRSSCCLGEASPVVVLQHSGADGRVHQQSVCAASTEALPVPMSVGTRPLPPRTTPRWQPRENMPQHSRRRP